eukprot:jgi/Mesen1/9798/ME000007S09858
MDGKILNKRTLKVCLASDNGRAREFIKRKEAREEPVGVRLGSRERPVAKKRRKGQVEGAHQPYASREHFEQEEGYGDEEDEDPSRFEDEGWASVVAPRPMAGLEALSGGQAAPARGALKVKTGSGDVCVHSCGSYVLLSLLHPPSFHM